MVSFQHELFAQPEPAFDAGFSGLRRLWLDGSAWVDHAPRWVSGSAALFQQVLDARKWGQRSRLMYEKKVLEPRLTAPWNLRSGKPLQPELLERMRVTLSERYRVVFDSIGFNLYRDGQDSVAWHGDRISKEIPDPIVALVSLGARRKFLMRPRGGGKSTPFMLGEGDLLVTGGSAQRTWDHAVPKVAHAAPRISLAFRYGVNVQVYGDGKSRDPQGGPTVDALVTDEH